jgi:proline iminopeptidase
MREGYVIVAGARLYYRELGAGPPLVILHGGPDFNHNYLLPEMDAWSSAFRLIYYDQRGRGKSSGDVRPEDVSIESDIEDLDVLRQHFGLESFNLLGHSWGGLLAMEYATRHPNHLSRLILMNAAPMSHVDLLHFRTQREALEPGNLAAKSAIAVTGKFLSGDILAEADYYRAHFRGTVRRAEDLERILRRLRSHFTPQDILKARAIEDRLYEQTWLQPTYDLLSKARQLHAPTLVISAEHDFVPMECPKHVVEAMPHARLIVLKDCGHFAFLEKPLETLNAVRDFVASTSLEG